MTRHALAVRSLNLLFMSISVCVFISAVFVIGPWIETKWFPAYSKFKIVSIERAGDRQSRVIFRFTKNRQCEPVGNSWFFGEPGAAFRQLKVQIDNQDAFTAVRPLGTQTSNPYVLDATVEELANATFAVIYNRCHPFWLTRSEIYP